MSEQIARLLAAARPRSLKPAHSKTNVSPLRIVDLSPFSFNNEIDHWFLLYDRWGLAGSGARALAGISSTPWVTASATQTTQKKKKQAGVETSLQLCRGAFLQLYLPVSFT